MKHILITGASEFIGKRLARLFLKKGYKVTGIGTSLQHPFFMEFENFDWISADTTIEGDWQNCVAILNIINALADNGKTQKLLTASAVGIYGDCREELLTEDKLPGHGFLAEVCQEWEKEGLKSQKAIPKNLTDSGYYFKFSDVKSALQYIFKGRGL